MVKSIGFCFLLSAFTMGSGRSSSLRIDGDSPTVPSSG